MRRETTSGYDVKVECYFSPECGTEKELRKNLDEALKAEALKADLTFRRIEQAVARAMGLKGSPAVLINGSELQPAQMEGFG